MRYAILTPTFSHFSGIDRLVEIQREKLVKQGHTVDIYTLKASIRAKGEIFELGIPENPFMERLYRLFMFLDFNKVKEYSDVLTKYDVIISHLYPMNILAYSAKKKNPKLKYIYHNAGVGITETYSFFEKIYLKLFNFFNNFTIRNCDSAISISKFLRDTLKRETGINSEVEYIDVDKKKFNKKVKGDKIRRKYHVKGPLLFYIGRISPHKGIHILIEAFKIVQNNYPKAKLIIAGKHTFPEYSRKVKKMANKDVIFAGFIPDKEVPYYYAGCDVYTTASLWEGFDMPIVEAYYTGKPSVAFDIGAHKEVLKKGILVKKIDSRDFANGILKVLK